MKLISFRDLMRVDWLNVPNEVSLLPITMDEKVNRALAILGFDIEYPIEYFAANHRDLSNHVGVGFMARGEININRKHLTGPFTTVCELIAASGHTDMELADDLHKIANRSQELSGESSARDKEVYPDDEDYDKLIRVLHQVRDSVRGPMYNEKGSLKTPEEYQEYLRMQKGNNDTTKN
jgi:hypothetical protein